MQSLLDREKSLPRCDSERLMTVFRDPLKNRRNVTLSTQQNMYTVERVYPNMTKDGTFINSNNLVIVENLFENKYCLLLMQ